MAWLRFRGDGRTDLQAPWTVGIADKGALGRTPPSASIRVHRRVRNSLRCGLAFDRLDVEQYAAGAGPRRDTLLVVRDAVPSLGVDALLDRLASERTRLVVDLDDDLVTDQARTRLVAQGYDAGRLAALARVLARADQVIVSTSHVQGLVRSSAPADVTVVPNELDPLLWFTPPSLPDLPEPDAAEVRLLYMGSKTHDADLDLLAGLPDRLASALGRPVVLEIVGVTAAEPPPAARRLVPPQVHYPGFVKWLRRNHLRWSAGLAPLADEQFNRAKSDLKLLEYAALGLPTVASPVGPYRDGGSPPLAALAASPDEWLDQVRRAIGSAGDHVERVRRERTMTPESLAAWHALLVG